VLKHLASPLTRTKPLTTWPTTHRVVTSWFLLRLQTNLYTIITCPAEYRDKMSAHLLSLLLASVSLAMPTSPNTLYYPERLFTRGGPSIQATDPFDRRWIESLTAVGDSYSVGLGAGHAVKATGKVHRSISSPGI